MPFLQLGNQRAHLPVFLVSFSFSVARAKAFPFPPPDGGGGGSFGCRRPRVRPGHQVAPATLRLFHSDAGYPVMMRCEPRPCDNLEHDSDWEQCEPLVSVAKASVTYFLV